MSGSMIIWNENTIKLIYEVQYITPMVILSIFGIRSIGCYRTFKGSDPNDDSDELCSNGNAPRMIEGNSNNMITRVAYALGHKTFGEGVLR
ncbi:MAG: hypothetical protein QOK84_04610 [Nitrososphaeraceae archaeon]|nr:hypothetical protein [Nitrososphaeraceae archaeon]